MDIEMSSDGTGGTVFTPEEEDREAWEMIGVSRVGVAIPDNDALLEVLMLTREGREEREPEGLFDRRHLSHNTYISNVNAYT